MARIAGVDLPRNKRIDIALTYVFGIGRNRGLEILDKADVGGGIRTDDLTEDQVRRIRQVIEGGYKVEGDLRREISMSIKRLMNLNCYRGIRHKRGLPVRGQRTNTNARTRKGPKRGIMSKKRK